jgi:hypothetical protein
MKSPVPLIAGTLLILGSWVPVHAQDKVGEAVYLEGGVSLQRNGEELQGPDVQTGLEIQNYDLVKTAADGLAEVSVDNPKAPAVTVKVAPHTQFAFELSKLGSRQQSSLGLMSGTVSLKVAKLAGSQDLRVVTASAVMGVRGTEFSVTAPPTGDILVTCASGDVVVTDEQGRELHAIPGTAIEKLEGADFHALAVTGADLESFRKDWEEKRIASLRARALEIMQRDALRYLDLVEEFKEDRAALDEKRDILARWEAEEKSGKIGGGPASVEADKREIVDLIGDLRETQFLLERLHYRLAELKGFHDQGLGEGDLRGGLTTKDFFASYTRDRTALERDMAQVRHDVKLFAHRNRDADPTFVADLHKYYQRRLANLKRLHARKLVKKGAGSQK